MKVPLSWLKEFVDLTLSPEDLAQRLTLAGLEVASITYIGVAGAELPWDREKILVANILEVKPHPNADRLVLADVDYGAPHPHTVVTGAPNLFPYKGQGRLTHPLKAVFAREGARLYDGHQAEPVITTLKGRPIRGVMSDAMLCSEKELGLSDDHEGILLLEDEAPVGMPLCDFMGEVVLDIDLTPNLARCLSIIGIAREVAAITGATLHTSDPQVVMEGPSITERVRVTVEDANLCPRFTAGLIEGITVRPSPQWMQRRLRAAGMRPINNIVDISNYVMLEWGQPTHAFDADRVQDQHLIVRLARPGERLTTLDGKDHDLIPATGGWPPLLVCDPSGPSAIAGVMGGEDSEVRVTTTRVLLEAAIWEPTQIRRTARALKLPSEASRRFERGVDLELPPIAQRRALELMRTLGGGVVAQGLIDIYPHPWQPLRLELSAAEVARIVGIDLPPAEIADLLRSVGFGCEVDTVRALVHVEVPSSRQDVTMLADLCEEVARLYGYDRIPITRLADELPAPESHPELEAEQHTRDVLVGCGLTEVITYSLTSMAAVANVNPADANAECYLRISNPISPEREYLRRSLLPTLLDALATNLRERERVQLFEIGRVFLPRSQPDTHGNWLPDEPHYLGIALAGPRDNLSWHTTSSTHMDFFDLKGVIETLLVHLRLIQDATFVPLTDDRRFHPGRAATLMLAPPARMGDTISPDATRKPETGQSNIARERVGVLGELHPDVCERLGITGTVSQPAVRVAAAEINLDALLTLTAAPRYQPISRYPATLQDLAVVAASDIPAAHVADVIRRGAGALLETLTLFDVYSGPQVGEGKRSLAYRLTFRAADRTLSDEALAKVRANIIKLLEREIDASIRK